MKYLLPFFLIVIESFIFVKITFAQSEATSSGIAIPTTITDSTVSSGNIVCSTDKGYSLCKAAYDSSIYGVVNSSPSVSLGSTSGSDKYVIVSGIVSVIVNTSNGNIIRGDLITTSETAGVGQKATKNGYVLGTALDSFSSNDSNQSSKILVSISIHSNSSFSNTNATKENLIELLRTGLSATVLTPIEALRYLLAAVVTVISFVLAFIYFGRLARAGIEGIARNPLAQGRIEFTVLFHIIITVCIFLTGLGISYLILRI